MEFTGSNYYHFIYTGSGNDLCLASETIFGNITVFDYGIYQTEVTGWVERHNATPISASQATDIWNTADTSSVNGILPSDYSDVIKYYYVNPESASIENSDQEYLSGSQPIHSWTSTIYRTKNQPWVTKVEGVELSHPHGETLYSASSSAS